MKIKLSLVIFAIIFIFGPYLPKNKTFMKSIILSFGLLLYTVVLYGQKVLFLHHSTGGGVYNGGKVSSWFASYNSIHSTNYQIFEKSYPDVPYPWENYPYDYWNLWINGGCNSSNPNIECLNSLCSKYNIIIFKHCFPGAGILPDDVSSSVSSSKKTLGNYKLQYRALRNLMDQYPQNKFIVWTLAPLHRLATNDANAARAKEFVDWVKNTWLNEDGLAHPNIYLFDFWGFAAENNSNPANGKLNCLKYVYETSHSDADSHPNASANEYIGPKFAEFIISVIQNGIKVTQITVNGQNGQNTINTDKGNLQMECSVLPENASNKTVTWSISSGAEYASISPTGLLTSIKNGTVNVKALANDGSGISGTKAITISNQKISITSIALNGTDNRVTINQSGGTLQINAIILPNDATNKTVTWSIAEGSSFATISSTGLLTAQKNGTVKVRATANDGSSVFGELVITISGQATMVNNFPRYKLNFYPNPAQDYIEIQNNLDLNGILSVYTLTGIKLKEVIVNQEEIDVSDLPEGYYIIHYHHNKMLFKQTLLIIR